MESANNGRDTLNGITMFRLLWSLGYSAQNYRIAPKTIEQVEGYSRQLMRNYILLGHVNFCSHSCDLVAPVLKILHQWRN